MPPTTPVQSWLLKIQKAKKREKEFRETGKEVLCIHDGERVDSVPFNILYANTAVLKPSLYSALPKPVVQRRFSDPDPISGAASIAGKRLLEYLLDTNWELSEDFNGATAAAVMDSLLPGRGVVRVSYKADVVSVGGQERIAAEGLSFEHVQWDRFIVGYSRKWQKTPWIAFEHHMNAEAARKNFKPEVVAKMQFTAAESEDKDEQKFDDGSDPLEKQAVVYEVWVLEGRKQIFLSECCPEGFLKESEDPYQLTGFYPIPKPLQLVLKTHSTKPTALYKLYENQAKELNRVTVRLNRLLEMLKIRGAYDSTLENMPEILKAEDGILLPVENVAALANEAGLEKALWLQPIDKVTAAVQQLLVNRAQIKQTIYEITGISDIIRGQTVASETATAQELKSQWGTVRLKDMQAAVQEFVRSLLRIGLEMAVTKFQQGTIEKITNLGYLTDQQVAQVQQVLMAAQMSGQPPPPQDLAAMQKPQWSPVLALLRDDQMRGYRIDIETDSTIALAAQDDTKQIQETLGAISTTMQALGPLIAEGVMPFQGAQAILLAIVRKMRFGQDIEQYIQAMQPPQKAQVDPKMVQKMQQELQATTQEAHQLQEENVGLKLELQAAKVEKGLADKSADLDRREMELQVREAQLKLEGDKQKIAADGVKNSMKAAADKQQMTAEKVKLAVKDAQAETLRQVKDMLAKAELVRAKSDAKRDAQEAAKEKKEPAEKEQKSPRKYKMSLRRGKDGRAEGADIEVSE